MHTMQSISGIMAALLLSSCGLADPSLQADWQHGARRAWVVAVGGVDAPALAAAGCVVPAQAFLPAGQRMAKLQYWHGRSVRTELALVPTALALMPGDEVEVWPEECARGQPARIGRVLTNVAPGQ